MLTKRIIPCMDIKGGRIVKGTHFVRLRDAGDPVETAAFYSNEGADEITFLDIAATNENRKTLFGLVEKTASQVFIPLTVGGGIREIEDIRTLLSCGADKISINTAAVKNPRLITEGADRFGSQCIVVAIDGKWYPRKNRWLIHTHGGSKPTEIDAVEWAKRVESLGAGEILLTSIDTDGTKDGYDLKLTRAISDSINIPVIASGGAGKPEHLYQAILQGKADAVLAASIFHYREYSIKEVKQYLADKGIPIRL